MTTAEAQKETRGFETEVSKLLHLMIHSLYSNKEIFLRELISNASDAIDKLRFESLDNSDLLEGDPDFHIDIDLDRDNGQIVIRDNGIGMSRDEVIANLGTIARSGTAQFLSQLSGDQQKDSQLIGQFGVGFYSAFIVAGKVDVYTRRAGLPPEEGVHWESRGEGEYSIETIERPERGTEIRLTLKPEAKEFLEGFKLKAIVRKYADHISVPVTMIKEEYTEEGELKATDERETVNSAKALWTRPKSEITEEEYKEFYNHVSHDWQEPLAWSHNKVEGKLEYTSLLYIPKKAPFDLYNRDTPRGLKLYVQRVFILDNAEQFLPLYLRFVKGVVDSNDLDLNVSREILQENDTVASMRKALTSRVLDMLSKMAANEPEKYAEFWKEFGDVIKEGVAEDHANRDKILALLRFSSTLDDNEEPRVSLADYVSRMKEGQNKIYYITGESFNACKNSPHLEIFRKRGIEVLLLPNKIDEWMMGHLFDYEGKSFQHVAKGKLDLGDIGKTEEEKQESEKLAEESKPLIKRVRDVLGEAVSDVAVTDRLTDSPACIVLSEHDLGPQMRKILEASGQPVPDTKPAFEINPSHPLIKQLAEEQDATRFESLIRVLFDQAVLAEGGSLDDPASFVRRVNELLTQ